MSELRKVSFYLKPDQNPADKVAVDMLDAMPVKMRGKASRAALLAGMALMKQDHRLPSLIAEILDEHTTISQIRHLLCSVLPEDAGSAVAALQQLLAFTQSEKPQAETTKIDAAPAILAGNTEIARQNARNLFP